MHAFTIYLAICFVSLILIALYVIKYKAIHREDFDK
jgi:hypothetical protein